MRGGFDKVEVWPSPLPRGGVAAPLRKWSRSFAAQTGRADTASSCGPVCPRPPRRNKDRYIFIDRRVDPSSKEHLSKIELEHGLKPRTSLCWSSGT